MHLDTRRFTGDAGNVLARWTIALGALAGPPDESLVVTGDRTCLTPEGVVARTRAWAPQTLWPADVVVTVDHHGTDLRIELAGAAGERIERSSSDVPAECRDVELMAAVAVAMALEAYEPARATVPEAATGAIAPAPLERAVPPPSVASTRDARLRARPTTALVLGVGGGLGAMPFASGEIALGARVQWRRVWCVGEVEIGARNVARFDGDRGRLALARIAVAVGVCSPWTRGRWTAALCGLVGAGTLHARTHATTRPRGAWVPWSAATLRTEVGLALGRRWTLGARSDLLIGIVRPTVSAARAGQRERWRTPTLGFRAALVLGVQIGGPVKRGPGRRMEGSE